MLGTVLISLKACCAQTEIHAYSRTQVQEQIKQGETRTHGMQATRAARILPAGRRCRQRTLRYQ